MELKRKDFRSHGVFHSVVLRALFATLLAVHCSAAENASALPIASISRTQPVDFENEILPILKESCLACHNQTKAKADLILETPQTILKGGESGPAVVPGNPPESLILKVARHLEKPFMPPKDNKVNAPDLTDQQLGILQLWIQQGARGELHNSQQISWQPLRESVRPILSLALTEDAQFAACGRGNELFIYQVPTERAVGPLCDADLRKFSSGATNAAHLDLVQSLDFSPDGTLLASGSYREVKLWRRKPFTEVPIPASASNSIAASVPWLLVTTNSSLELWKNDGKGGKDEKFLSADSAGTVRVWKTADATNVLTFTNQAAIMTLACSADGKQAALAGEDKIVRLWNLEDGKLLRELRGDYPSNVRLAQLQRANAYAKTHIAYRKGVLDAATKERTAQVQRVRKAGEADTAAEKPIADKEKELNSAKTNLVAAEKVLSDVRGEVKAAQDKLEGADAELKKSKVALLATNAPITEKAIEELTAKATEAANARNALAALKPEAEKKEKAADEKVKAAQKAVSDADAALKKVQLAKAAAENELQFAITAAQKSFDAFSEGQDGVQLVESDLKSSETFLEAARVSWTNSMQTSVCLAFSPDGTTLASANSDGRIHIWSTRTGQPLAAINAATSLTSVAFRQDGTLLAASGEELHAWNLTPAWELERVIGSSSGDAAFIDRVSALRFSPDGQFLVTGGGEPSRSGELKVWRVKDGQFVREFKNLHSDVILSLDFTPDGRYLASGGADRFARISDFASGKLLRSLEGHTHHVMAVSWKRDGHTLMTAGADNVIKVWDAFTGEKKKNIEGFNKEVTALAFLADTDQALTASGDTTLRLIKENGEKVRTFEGSASFLQAAAASRDGALVLAGGQDGILRIWRSETGKLVSQYP